MAFDAGSIEATLTLNRNPFTEGLRLARRQANEFERNEIEVPIKPTLQQEAVTKIRERLNRITGTATVRARLDQTTLTNIRNRINNAVGRINVRAQLEQASLTAIRERINRAVGTIKVRAEFDNASLAALRARLAAIRNVVIRVKIEIDDTDLLRLLLLLRQIRDGLRDATSEGNRFGGSLGRAGSAGGGLLRMLMVGLPVILPLLASAVVAVTGLAGALLSAGTIAAAGLGSIAIVAKPVWDAISEGAKKSAAEIAKLPNGIRQGAAALKEMQAEWKKLVTATQGTVGNAMAEGFRAATTVLKQMAPIINATAKALGDIGKQINSYFQSKHWKDFLTFLQGAVGPILQKLFEIVAYGTRAVLNLTKAFEPLAQWILQGIANGMREFAAWSEKLGKDEGFKKFVALVKDSLPKVWDFLQTTITFLFNLSVALAPIGNLMLDFLTKVFDGLSKIPPEFLGPIAIGLAAIFTAIALGATGPVGVVVGLIVALAAGLKYLYEKSAPVRQLFDGIAQDIKNWWQPTWESLVKLFNEKVKPAWENLIKVVKEKFLPLAQKLWEDFKKNVLPVLSDVAEFIVGDLIPAFLDFAAKVAPILAWIYDKIGPVIIEVFERVIRVVQGALTIISGVLQMFAGLFSGDWKKMWEGIQKIAEGIWTIIAGAFGMTLNELKLKVYNWAQDISAKWQEFWDWVSNTASDFWEKIKTGWNDFWQGLQDWFTQKKDAITQGWNDFWANFDKVLSDYINNVKTAWNNFWQGIYDWVAQKWEDIKTGWNNFWTNFTSTLSSYIDNVKTVWNNFWQNVWQVASDIWERIKSTVSSALEAVKSAVGQAVTALDQAWRGVANVFRAPINWVVQVVINDGILGGWNTVMGWIGAPGLTVSKIPPIPEFATGGPIPMLPGSVQGKDSVLLRAMPGEFILSTKDVAAMGGIRGVEGMRRKARGDKNGRSYHETFNGDPRYRIPGFADGGAVERAKTFAQAQAGKPYIWGGVGPGGYDCSGFMSAITNVLRGANPYSRLFTTASFANGPVAGFVNGLSSAFSIGVKQGNPGHMAGTLGGMNVESTGNAVRVGAAAAGADHSQFTGRFSLPEIGGVFASGGGGGATPVSWWSVVGSRVQALFNGLIDLATRNMPFVGSPIGQKMLNFPIGLVNNTVEALKKKLTALMTVSVSGQAGPASDQMASVMDAVRRVAVDYGWGDGAEWDALAEIIRRESGWNPNAANPTSSARGLFQKMTSIHGPVESTITGQARWGLNYIRGKYGDPINALAYHNAHGNYRNGGWLMPGAYGYNETTTPEAIFNRPQLTAMDQAIREYAKRGALDDEFVEKIRMALGAGSGDGGVNIGSVTLPYGASVRELTDECFFRVKHSKKGRYGGKRW